MTHHKLLAFGLLIITSCSILTAEADAYVTKGYFDLDKKIDKIEYYYHENTDEDDSGGLATIKITLDAKNDKTHHVIVKSYEMSSRHLFIRNSSPGEIAIFEPGDLGGSIKSTNFYDYNQTNGNWYLVKSIMENPGDYTDVRHRYTITYYDGTEPLSSYDPSIPANNAKIETKNQRILRLQGRLSSIYTDLEQLYKAKKLSLSNKPLCEPLEIAEIIFNIPVTDKNVEQYNNVAFFLEKAPDNDQINYWNAIYILQNVIDKVPERTPAYLNLADVYNKINEQDLADKYYKKYVSRMRQDGKEKLIPNRVLKILNNHADD